ncbi:MAG: glycosyltransferase family 39 protein [Elusimicrobiales bacterium]|nr:glycosyltransferase family 39 protein [Elusimicrobiales bacterium]
MYKKRGEEKRVLYNYKTKIFLTILPIIVFYLVLSEILNYYPPNFTIFISALNPFMYLKNIKFNIVLYNLKEIFYILTFLSATISIGKFLEKVGAINKYPIYIIYAIGTIFNCFIALITGFLGLISQSIYIFIISFEIMIGIYLMLKKDFRIKNNLKFNLKGTKIHLYLTLFILSLIFINSLSPEIFYDSLNYHLAAPNWWIINGKISDMPNHMYYKLPLTYALNYLIPLTVFGEQTPLLVNFITFLFFIVFIIYGFQEYLTPKTSIMAGFIFASIFHVYITAQSATADIFSSFIAALVLKMFTQYYNTNSVKDILLAGIFAGVAFSSKYNTAFITLSFLLIFIYDRYKSKIIYKKIIFEILIFSIGFMLFFLPWAIKNFINYSNPIFPFLHEHFCNSCSNSEIYRIKGFIKEVKQFDEMSIIEWLKTPFLVSIGKIPNSEFFLPLFFIILPLGIFNKKNNFLIQRLSISFVFSYIAWSTSTTYIRHFFPSFFIMSILAAYYINEAFDGVISSVLKIIFAIVMFINTIWLVNYFAIEKRYEPVFGFITKEEYLSKSRMRYPYPSYPMYDYINKNLSKEDKILIFGDSRTFYLKIPHETASVFDIHPLVEISEKSKNGDEIYKKLKNMGFTHIMVNLAEGYRIKSYGNHYFSKTAYEKFDDFFKNHLIVENEWQEIDKNKINQKIILYLIVEKNMVKDFNYFQYFIQP